MKKAELDTLADEYVQWPDQEYEYDEVPIGQLCHAELSAFKAGAEAMLQAVLNKLPKNEEWCSATRLQLEHDFSELIQLQS